MENEFKYRANDKRPQPPPLPPPQQSAYPHSAATYFSGGSMRGEGGYARMVPPAMSASEEFQRAVEKERIRREIIAEEMARARRRELEEEVRREMALERELGIPMQRSLGPPPQPPPPQRFLVLERVKLAIEDIPPPQPRILGLAENQDQFREQVNLRLNPRSNLIAIEDMPQPRIMDTSEISSTNNEVIQLAKPNPGVYDAKRKAAEPAVTQFGLMKKPKKVWRCELCEISATDEKGLNAHLRGKKHKAKEASQLAEMIGLDVKPDIQTHHALVEEGMTQNNVDAVEGEKEEQVVQKSQSIGVSEIKEVSTEEASQGAEKIGKSTSSSLSPMKSNMNVKSIETETIITTTIGLDVEPDIQTHHALVEGSTTQNNVDAVEGEKEEKVVHKSQSIGVSEIKEVSTEEASQGAEKIGKSTSSSLSPMKSNMNVKSIETETIITTTIGLDVKPDIQTHHALVEGSMTQNNVDAVESEKEEQVVQKSQSIGVSEIKEVSTEEAGKTNVFVGRKRKFWCDICGISTLSQGVMENHKRGRKHQRRMENTMSQNNGSAPHTSSADNFSCSEKVHLDASS